LRENGDDHAVAGDGGVQAVPEEDDAAPRGLRVVQEGPDLAHAAAGEAVQLPNEEGAARRSLQPAYGGLKLGAADVLEAGEDVPERSDEAEALPGDRFG